jgi:electron transfer flavoprotein alpha subunit
VGNFYLQKKRLKIRIRRIDMNKIMVFAEQREGELKKITLENLTLARNLAHTMDLEFLTVIIGANIMGLVQKLGQYGAKKILVYQADNLALYNSEQYAAIMADAVKKFDSKIIILGATAMGKDLAPRIAARLDATLSTDCISVQWENENLNITRPMYAGKVRASIQLSSNIKIITVRPNIYLAQETPVQLEVSEESFNPITPKAIVKEILAGAKDKLDVTEADIIVSGGRGLKGPENFHLIESLAKKLGAAQGASRAVVDAGWRPYDEQVGQTGKTVSPTLYIAIGISGAIQHLAGMSSSKYIVAINKDPEAPIFKIADYGIVGDAFEVVPRLIEELPEH